MTDLDTASSFEAANLEVLSDGGRLTPDGESSRLPPSENSCVELDGSHPVTCTLTISLAVPILSTGQKQQKLSPSSTQGKQIKADELGATPSVYQIEYLLLPDDLEPRKLELVVFGVAAKLSTESDSEDITPWVENDRMWVSWNHSVDIGVTNEYLIKLRDHKIIFKIWNTKDKGVSKPKNSKPLLEENAEAVDGVKHTVLLQRKHFEESQPAASCTKIKAAKQPKVQGKSSALPGEEKETDLDELATSDGLLHPSRTEDGGTASSVMFEKKQSVKQKGVSRSGRSGSGPKRSTGSTGAKNYGIASLQIELMPLLSGEKSVTSHLAGANPDILDVYVSFSVDTPLLSERQRHELNPLVIRITSATCLPNTPVPIAVLQKLCIPTYCKYKFHNFPPHQTHGQIHGTHVYFKDVNVLLTGLMKPGELQMCLQGPPLEIEVHDRDRNMENSKKEPSLSGKDETGEKVDKLSFLACKCTDQKPFTKNTVRHPHGVAKVSLSDLLLGQKYLTISAPIHSCSASDPAALSEEDEKQTRTESMSSSSPLPMGHYLESHSVLTVRVEIAVPLGVHEENADAGVTSCPYGLIIYIFDYSNSSLLHDLVEEITEINAKGLQLDCSPVHLMGMALAASKLKTTPEKVSQLDVVTGFHLMDGSTHLFVLEGLKDKAIRRLWERHLERTHRQEEGQLEVLYNSQLSFQHRQYSDLESLCYHFCLCQPLCTLTKQPLLYVRRMVPWMCFQALSRLSYLCGSKRLRTVIRGDLLPSAEMIRVLSHEYGVPLKDEHLFPQKPPLVAFGDTGEVGRVEEEHSLLDSNSGMCVQKKEEIAEKNFIKANISALCQLQGKMKKPKLEVFRISPVAGKPVFNYSCQRLNSAELAKQQLRQELAKKPKKRFTYCQEYLSAIFDLVDVDAACKESYAHSKSMWMSPDGFVLPGCKSSIESSLPPLLPAGTRGKELQEQWQENALHAHLRPVLPRDRWSWDKRHLDFDLYKKPPELFMLTAPQNDAAGTLQPPSGARKVKAEQLPTALQFPSPGPPARAQLQNLQGHLKDEPLTTSPRKAGPVLKVIWGCLWVLLCDALSLAQYFWQ
ncbi:uncharacterized protein CFAP92 isoform X1 [Heliangelus exortis]|uniref:uncharacterized protein CFAP92 isoform X1 n=1 Tax=Heliangelus exortis TaxID=472823 RepID=UPI003A94984C